MDTRGCGNTPPVVGIDLGSTYSCIWAFHNGETVRILADSSNSKLACCVLFTGDRAKGNLVGHEAKDQMHSYPAKDAVFDATRMLGYKFDDPSLSGSREEWPYHIHETAEHTIKLEVPDLDGQQQLLPPEEVVCLLLEALLDAASKQLGARPTEAVITVPACYGEPHCDAVRDAAELAGLAVLCLVDEPRAAVIAYGRQAPQLRERTVLVFDLGGATFDASLLKLRGEDITMLANAHNSQLGGNKFDQRLLEWLIEELLKEFPGIPLDADAQVMTRLRSQVEKAKIAVNAASYGYSYLIQVDDVAWGAGFRRTLTTEKFNELNEDLFQLCFRGDAAGKGGLDELFGARGEGGPFKQSDVDVILPVGGSDNIPRVRELLSEYFGDRELAWGAGADRSAAQGAAHMAGTQQAGQGTQHEPEQTRGTLFISTTGDRVSYYPGGDSTTALGNAFATTVIEEIC